MSQEIKQGKNFVFTWNNPSEMPAIDGEWIACEEYGDSGTRHLQGYVRFKGNYRLPALKKIIPEAHWENRKGSHMEAYNYCIKGEECNYATKFKFHGKYYKGNGVPIEGSNMEPELSSGKRSDLEGARERILSHGTYAEIAQDPELEEVLAKYPRWVKDVHNFRPVPLLEGVTLRPWQQSLLDDLSGNPNPRSIFWVFDTVGNCGKSWMATFLLRNHNAIVFTGGKAPDLAYAYDNQKIVVFDFARATDFEKVSYNALEDFKNGRIFSSKYESTIKVFAVPHVVVFANVPPPEGKFSKDRLEVVDLDAKRLKRARDICCAENFSLPSSKVTRLLGKELIEEIEK